MPTPMRDDQGHELLPDDEYDRLGELGPEGRAELPRELKEKYEATRLWHYEQRMALSSLEGIDIGGKSIAETLDEIHEAKG